SCQGAIHTWSEDNGRRFHLCRHLEGLCSCGIRLSTHYSERLAEAGIEPSVGSVGDSYDNALAETVPSICSRRGHPSSRAWRSFEAVEHATLERVDWFNNRRLLESIGNIPPAEAEANF
ncbi:hypothetical protein E3D03_017555, partial [Paracoccus sp. DMF]|nr:hypothetical protein [Paracoccus sp. DMF]